MEKQRKEDNEDRLLVDKKISCTSYNIHTIDMSIRSILVERVGYIVR